jgi:hypothetical protein
VHQNPRADGQDPYAVLSWYQLTNIQTGDKESFYPSGTLMAPFLYFSSKQNGKPTGAPVGSTMQGQLAFQGYQRKVTFIKKTAVTAMVCEAAGINWLFSGAGRPTSPRPTAKTIT